MANQTPQGVTLRTVHEDLTAGFADLKGEIADLKGTLIAGFRGLPSRESSEEMVRLLREGNRLQEERFTQLDLRIREQHLEVQQVLHAVVDGQRLLINEVRNLSGEVRNLSGEIRGLAGDIKALIARLDALIKGRGDGGPAS